MAIPHVITRMGYTFLFLLALSRFYTLLITLDVVPGFPDPVVEFLAKGQEKIEAFLGGGSAGEGREGSGSGLMDGPLGNLVGSTVGTVVFGIMMRIYAPRGDGADGKRRARGMARQYLIIFGRVAQCVLFVGRDCAIEALWSGGRCGVEGAECSRGWPCLWRVVDLCLSAGVAALEVKKVRWDGGLIDRGIEVVSGMFSSGVESQKEGGNEEVTDGDEGKGERSTVPVAGSRKKGRKQR